VTDRIGRRSILAAVPAFVLAACGKGRSNASGPTTTAATARPGAVGSSSTTGTGAALPAFVRHGPSTGDAVALTFHGSGDLALLHDLLAIASDHHAALTIFAVGQWLDANPAVARQILDGGHELANHTYTHPGLGSVAAPQVRDEITRCRDALHRHSGSTGRWFRPSGVETPNQTIMAAAAAAGYATIVGYDVDPRDYQDPGAAAIRSRVAAGLHPGAIISLHTGHRGTVDALPAVLDGLATRKLRPVTVSTLLA
jgi:peptidoglycan/xylan/chitin deacetylase (PgdA/CDA1 family)